MTEKKKLIVNHKVSFKGTFIYFDELNKELKKKNRNFRKISTILKKNLYNFGLIIQTDFFFFCGNR